MKKTLIALVLASPAALSQIVQVPVPPNIVLIVLDDFGVELLGRYGEYPPTAMAPMTPNLDGLADNGLRFRNCWSDPVCSPTRAQILTGRHGFRTGIGTGVKAGGGLALSEVTIAEELRSLAPYPYATSAVGKWHLAQRPTNPSNLACESPMTSAEYQAYAALYADYMVHPMDQGFTYYAGCMANILKYPMAGTNPCGRGKSQVPCRVGEYRYSYCQWIKNNNGIEDCHNGHATLDTTQDAMARATSMDSTGKPWFLYVAYNAVHHPFHDPMDADCMDSGDDPADLNLMVEHLDASIGVLTAHVRALDPDALIIVIGDNGTDGSAIVGKECFVGPHAKGSMYEAGINVPLIINGPDVPPADVYALVSATDLFRTIMKIAGSNATAADSHSLTPFFADPTKVGRPFVYSEIFTPNVAPGQFGVVPPARHRRAVRDRAGYKLIVETKDTGEWFEEFYDLSTDPCEMTPICSSVGGPCALSTPTYTQAEVDAYCTLVNELRSRGVYPASTHCP